MRLGGRVQAAIEVLQDLNDRPRPVGAALKDWGLAHRFAGAGDRAAIGNLVYDSVRRQGSLAAQVGSRTPRMLVLACLVSWWKLDPSELNNQWEGDRFAPDPITQDEADRLTAPVPKDANPWDLADLPEWLWEIFDDAYEEDALVEAQALASRPPVDLRVNNLKAGRDKVARALRGARFLETPISPNGLRFPAGETFDRTPNIQSDEVYRKGWVEIQDEGSQIAADLVFAQPGDKILDYCAGAGGKTLALAANMGNKGQVFAYDADKTRLAPIYERLKRAGTRNVQVRAPGKDVLDDLIGKCDKVLVDAPCSGSGTWRRRPETKWKLTPEQLEARMAEQGKVLSEARQFVRPGGYLCYVTCSVLPQENEIQVYTFLEENEGFELISAGEVWEELYGTGGPKPWSSDGCTVTLTPASTGTDGFFFAVMQKLK